MHSIIPCEFFSEFFRFLFCLINIFGAFNFPLKIHFGTIR